MLSIEEWLLVNKRFSAVERKGKEREGKGNNNNKKSVVNFPEQWKDFSVVACKFKKED